MNAIRVRMKTNQSDARKRLKAISRLITTTDLSNYSDLDGVAGFGAESVL